MPRGFRQPLGTRLLPITNPSCRTSRLTCSVGNVAPDSLGYLAPVTAAQALQDWIYRPRGGRSARMAAAFEANSLCLSGFAAPECPHSAELGVPVVANRSRDAVTFVVGLKT